MTRPAPYGFDDVSDDKSCLVALPLIVWHLIKTRWFG